MCKLVSIIPRHVLVCREPKPDEDGVPASAASHAAPCHESRPEATAGQGATGLQGAGQNNTPFKAGRVLAIQLLRLFPRYRTCDCRNTLVVFWKAFHLAGGVES